MGGGVAKSAQARKAGADSPPATRVKARAAGVKKTSHETKATSPRPASRRGQAARQERRKQILEAAREAFAKRGYARSTVEDIVLEAGVARGTFYLYFDDKRDALEELIDGFGAQITAAIVRIVTDQADQPVADQVLENIRAIVGVCLAERSMTKILLADAVGVDPEFERKLARFYDAVIQLLTESLRDGQALGVVADGEPKVLAYLTLGALKELMYQAVTLGLSAESTEALTAQIYDFLSRGYLRVATGGSRGGRRRR
jgi:AcrR family transcriptional regulator